MASSANIYTVYKTAGSSDAVTSPEDLQRSVAEFGEKLRQLKEQESYAPSREWLEDAERWHQRLKTSLEDYGRERAALQYRMVRAQQLADESARETSAGQTMTEGFRKTRDGLTKAFNRAFGRDQEPEPGPRVTKAQEEAANHEERRRAWFGALGGPTNRG
jgi:hypothetical protein